MKYIVMQRKVGDLTQEVPVMFAPEAALRQRDTKGLYARGAYQVPYQEGRPELQFDTTVWSVEEIVNHIMEYVR